MNTIIGMCKRCGDSLTNGHVCHKWMLPKEKSMDKNIMIAHLRNPYGVDEIELRKARLQAADELERLYKIEKGIKTLINSVTPDILVNHHPV